MKNFLTAVCMLLTIISCKKDLTSDPSPQVEKKAYNLSTLTAGKRIYFTNAGNWVDNNFSYSPGDTFVLKAGIDYTYFSMSNVHDVVFINEGGIVTMQNGFNLNSCTNIHITGTGSNDFMALKYQDTQAVMLV